MYRYVDISKVVIIRFSLPSPSYLHPVLYSCSQYSNMHPLSPNQREQIVLETEIFLHPCVSFKMSPLPDVAVRVKNGHEPDIQYYGFIHT